MITSLLTNEYTDFDGSYYHLTHARCEPKPVQKRIPIVIGGRGPNRTLPAVARWADMWDLAGPDSPEAWKALSDVLDQRCAAIGRDADGDPPIGAPDVAGGCRSIGDGRHCGRLRSGRRRSGDLLDASALQGGALEPLVKAIAELAADERDYPSTSMLTTSPSILVA